MKSSARNEEAVRYLSQQFVEELCSEDHAGKELLREVEAVVFSYLDEPERLGASSFHELRQTRTSEHRHERDQLRAAIITLNSQIIEIGEQIASRPSKETKTQEIDKDIASLKGQMPEIKDEAERQRVENLEAQRKILRSKNAELTQIKQYLQKIALVYKRVGRMREANQ